MNIKKKVIISIVSMFTVLFLIPLILVNSAKAHEFMGIMMLLFFLINPILAAVLNMLIGKDIKKLWLMPLLYSIVFLLSYWLVLEEIILDLIIYAGIYLVIGTVFMILSFYLNKKLM